MTQTAAQNIEQPTFTLHEKVEQRLRAAQEKKQFKDTEGRIGGSKKQKMAYKLVAMSDLDAIEKDELTAIELVKKDKVYPKVDAAKEREAGVSSGAAFLKTKMRESFSNNPPNNADKRRVYVGYINYLVNRFLNVVSVQQFEELLLPLMDDGIEEIIKIMKPELIPQIEEERQNNVRELAESKRLHNELEELADVQRQYLFATYPHLKNSFGGLEMDDIPDSDMAKHTYLEHLSKAKELRNNISKLANAEFSSITKKFLESMSLSSRYSSKWSITQEIFEEIFGKRFVNFIRKASDAVGQTFDTARDYEALSAEESEKYIVKNTTHYVSHLQSSKEDLATVQTLVTREEFDAFFETRGNTGFSGGDFYKWQSRKQKYFYYKDCKTPEQIEAYRRRWVENTMQQVTQYERSIAKIKDKYRARANNWDWAFNKKATETKTKAELIINRGVPLEYIKRTGGIKITDEDVTVESVREKFGFKQVEFGQTLKDAEAREHIRHFLGAMADWGDILNMDVVQINQRGGLSMAFASRGAGKAMAHYEPLRKIINITKSRGDGTVAHEFTHYIDNLLRMLDGTAAPNPMTRGGAYATTNIRTNRSYYYSDTNSLNNDTVNRALYNIFNYILNRKKPTEETAQLKVFIKKTIDASDRKFTFPSSIKGDTIEEYLSSFVSYYYQYRFIENLKPRDYEILGAIVSRFGYKSYEFTFETKTTAFYANSLKMSSDYWVRQWELFARASETYIEDKLTKAGRANNYLVGGNYEDVSWQGVYPVGQERAELFELYDALFAAIKQEYKIGDFKPWTTERTDEYIELKDEDTEETESKVVVEADTETEPDMSRIKDKLKQLAALLNTGTMESGGTVSEQAPSSDLLIKYLNS